MSVCRGSRQPAMHRHPTSPFSVHGPEGWELRWSPHALSSGSLQRQECLFCQAFESRRMFGEGFEQRFTLVIMVRVALRGRLGSVPALTPCIQDREPRWISSWCSCRRDDTGMDYRAKRPKLAPNNAVALSLNISCFHLLLNLRKLN